MSFKDDVMRAAIDSQITATGTVTGKFKPQEKEYKGRQYTEQNIYVDNILCRFFNQEEVRAEKGNKITLTGTVKLGQNEKRALSQCELKQGNSQPPAQSGQGKSGAQNFISFAVGYATRLVESKDIKLGELMDCALALSGCMAAMETTDAFRQLVETKGFDVPPAEENSVVDGVDDEIPF